MTERLHFHFSLSCIGEGNGNPLQYSCLENPRDGGACWAAIYVVAQSWTWLKRLSSSSRIVDYFCDLWGKSSIKSHRTMQYHISATSKTWKKTEWCFLLNRNLAYLFGLFIKQMDIREKSGLAKSNWVMIPISALFLDVILLLEWISS